MKENAYFHLPGLFEFYELYRMFLPLFREHREYFYDWCEIGSIYGAPADCIWGGGRAGFGENDPEEVLELMQELQKKLGMAIIMVTHDLGVIADMCDEIIVMYGGRVCERGTAEDIFYRPHHEYTKGLLRSIPNVDRIGEKLIPIPGTPINLLNMPKGCAFCPRCENAMKICIEEVPQEMQMPDGHYASCWLNVKEAMEAKQGGGKHE